MQMGTLFIHPSIQDGSISSTLFLYIMDLYSSNMMFFIIPATWRYSLLLPKTRATRLRRFFRMFHTFTRTNANANCKSRLAAFRLLHCLSTTVGSLWRTLNRVQKVPNFCTYLRILADSTRFESTLIIVSVLLSAATHACVENLCSLLYFSASSCEKPA